VLSIQCDACYSDLVAGIRERARAEHIAEIVRLARQHLERDGAANLSLRAIARDLGMASSAIYRYFASRDELLTRLIIDSYDRLGEAVEAADREVTRRRDFLGRWRAMALAIRVWAFAHPAEYSLLFGTPVPGYAAPADTIGPASRYTVALLQLTSDMEFAGHTATDKVPAALRRDFALLRTQALPLASDPLLMKGMAAWASVMGAISLELFGHLHSVVDTPGVFFEAVVELQGRQLLTGTNDSSRTSKAT